MAGDTPTPRTTISRADALCMEALACSNTALGRALLRMVQDANNCRQTGSPCEADWRTCGCAVERAGREREELDDAS